MEKWAIAGLLPWGAISVLFAESGEGRTWLSLLLSRKVIKEQNARVVYLDGHNPLPYIKQMLTLFGLKEYLKKKLFYFYGRSEENSIICPKNPQWQTMKKDLMALSKTLLIVDTLWNATCYNSNSYKEMSIFFGELRDINKNGNAVLVVHEAKKYARSKKNKNRIWKEYKGSGAIEEFSDGVFYMERHDANYLIRGMSRFLDEISIVYTPDDLLNGIYITKT